LTQGFIQEPQQNLQAQGHLFQQQQQLLKERQLHQVGPFGEGHQTPSQSFQDRPNIFLTSRSQLRPDPEEVKILSETGDVFKFCLDADGNLSHDVVNAVFPGIVALKYRRNDQTW
jgi:hypothetical protein